MSFSPEHTADPRGTYACFLACILLVDTNCWLLLLGDNGWMLGLPLLGLLLVLPTILGSIWLWHGELRRRWLVNILVSLLVFTGGWWLVFNRDPFQVVLVLPSILSAIWLWRKAFQHRWVVGLLLGLRLAGVTAFVLLALAFTDGGGGELMAILLFAAGIGLSIGTSWLPLPLRQRLTLSLIWYTGTYLLAGGIGLSL